jgi:hypothetical protein
MTPKTTAAAIWSVLAAASPVSAADLACEEIREVGTLEFGIDPHRPERVVDIFWSDPEAVASHDFSWQTIAETLVSRYDCGEGITPQPNGATPWTSKAKNVRKALSAAGDACAAERAAVIQQLVRGAIKQGVEASWTPTRKLWKCEQRLARRRARKVSPPTRPLSKRDQCIADGNPPNVCDAASLF